MLVHCTAVVCIVTILYHTCTLYSSSVYSNCIVSHLYTTAVVYMLTVLYHACTLYSSSVYSNYCTILVHRTAIVYIVDSNYVLPEWQLAIHLALIKTVLAPCFPWKKIANLVRGESSCFKVE